MIISRKKYEKLNDDLIDAKAKVDDAKKSLDEENKSMRATLLIKEQRDQYKAERDTLNSKLNQSYEDNYKLEGQLHDMTKQRDTLIDDIAVLKANISRLEQIRDIKDSALKGADIKIKTLERENEKKNMDADRLGYRWRNSHDEAKTYKSLLSEISQHIGNKPSSSTYKYFRAKLDNLNITEDK